MTRYFAYVFALLKAHLRKRNVPIFVVICVTNRCNLRCLYCYEEYYDRNHPEMTTAELLALVDELAAMGTRYISINGGEALLRDDLDEIVGRARQKGMLVHLSTNGLLIKKRLPLLRKIDSIAISLDGIGDANDANRGSGTYAKIKEGLDCLKAAGIPFHTHTVLTRNNKDGLDGIFQLAREYGFRAQISTLRQADSPAKDIGPSDEEGRAAVGRILEYKRRGYPVFFSTAAYENFLRWPLPYAEQFIIRPPAGYKARPCYMKRFACHIEANGLMYPCIVLVNKFPALNVREVGARKAWEHLAVNPCVACHNICCNDLNLIFGFNPVSFLNANRVVWERLWRKRR